MPSLRRPLSRRPTPTTCKILHVGSYPGYFSWFQVSLKSVEKCGSCGGGNFGLSIYLAQRLYNSLLLSHKLWFGLKCLIRPPKSCFGGVLTPKPYFFYFVSPIRPYLTRKHAFWAIGGRDRSSGVTCRRGQEYKKNGTQKVTENALHTQTPFPSSHINQILRVGSYRGCLSWF